jgi:exosome complex component RRP41
VFHKLMNCGSADLVEISHKWDPRLVPKIWQFRVVCCSERYICNTGSRKYLYIMQHAEILALAGLRVDGRRPEELRSIRHRMGVTPHADGSIYYEQGLNKILVNVHGPQEPVRRPEDQENGTIKVQLLNAAFSGTDWKRRRAGDKRTTEIETAVQNTLGGVVMLELYPRSEIVLVVHVLESDGSTLCAIINAASLALMHAGVSMRDIAVACSVGMVQGRLCRDCTQVEQNSGGAYLPVALRGRSEEVLLINLDAKLSVDSLESAMQQAIAGCRMQRAFMENAMKEYMLLAGAGAGAEVGAMD